MSRLYKFYIWNICPPYLTRYERKAEDHITSSLPWCKSNTCHFYLQLPWLLLVTCLSNSSICSLWPSLKLEKRKKERKKEEKGKEGWEREDMREKPVLRYIWSKRAREQGKDTYQQGMMYLELCKVFSWMKKKWMDIGR